MIIISFVSQMKKEWRSRWMLKNWRERSQWIGIKTDQHSIRIRASGTEDNQSRNAEPDAEGAKELKRSTQPSSRVHHSISGGRATNSEKGGRVAEQERERCPRPSSDPTVQKQDSGGGHTRSSLSECGLRSRSAGYLSAHPPNGRSFHWIGPVLFIYFHTFVMMI